MADSPTVPLPPVPSGASPGSARAPVPSAGSALQTDRGTTSISASVVAKIAGTATREIPGVYAMGKGLSRAFGSLRSRVPGGSPATSQGVSVEVGQTQAAVDLDIVAWYGQSVADTAMAIRENVIDRIESLTGLHVVEVNVNVDDLQVDTGDSADGGSRVE